MMAFRSWLAAILLVSSVYQTWQITTCPQHVAIEKGTNYSINCTTASDVNDFYWYKGPAVDRDLIGKLESGAVAISKTYMGDYDVSRSGALLILNARVTHEYLYDLVTYDGNYNPEEERVIVNITISPESPCPLINNCTSCTKCDLLKTEKSSGTLTCRVERSRPAVPLRWKTLDQNGVAVTFHPQIQKGDASTDTWNSSVSLNYNFKVPCGAKITLQCLAQDTQHILNSEVSTTEVSTGPCNPGTAANLPLDEMFTTSSPEKSKMAAVLIPVLLTLFGIVVIVAIAKLRKRRNTDHGAQLGLSLLQSDLDSESVEKFIRTLKRESREKFCFLQPLPWGNKIDIEHLYTESFCKVTTQNGETLDVTSTELTKTKNITNQRLVTFIGEHGDGRTTFFKNVVYEWSKGMEDLYLVVFIPLKEVEKDKSLSKYLIEDILKTKKFKNELEAILKCEDKHCLVILDGLEDLSESFGNSRRDGNTEDPVTIAEILQGPERDLFTNFHVWISSREEDLNSFPHLKHHVKVEMKGISIQLINVYIKKCCWYYFNNVPGALNKDSNVERNDVTEDDKDLIEEDNDVYWKVQNFFKENNVLKDYGNRPLLINLMVHIMAMNFTSGIADLPKDAIKNMGLLLHVVIKCMKERHKNKFPTFSDEQFSKIEYKLGETAVRYKTTLEVRDNFFWAKEIGDEYFKTACEIGLLKIIKDSTSNARYSGIEFYHPYIQEYLAALVIIRKLPNDGDWKKTIENWGNDNSKRLIKLIEELNDLNDLFGLSV